MAGCLVPEEGLWKSMDDKGYVYDPAPEDLPHFVAAKETAVIVQLSGAEKFRTDYVKK